MMTSIAEHPGQTTRPEIVTLVIPCQADYVSVARMMIAGVASRLHFSADTVEDIRMAVSEVCTDSIERASAHEPETIAGLTIEVIALVSKDSITVDVIDHIPPHAQASPGAHKNNGIAFPFEDSQAIRDALIEELVDTFSRSHERGGTFVKLTKYLDDEQAV